MLQVEQWPAFQVRISHLYGQHIRVHLSIESLFIDGGSLRILMREFIHLYYEPEASFPSLELTFRDYVLAERHNYRLRNYTDVHIAIGLTALGPSTCPRSATSDRSSILGTTSFCDLAKPNWR